MKYDLTGWRGCLQADATASWVTLHERQGGMEMPNPYFARSARAESVRVQVKETTSAKQILPELPGGCTLEVIDERPGWRFAFVEA